jgi:hypothetical protein
MAASSITLTITVKVDPADIANLEGLARDAQALADRLREMNTPTPEQPVAGQQAELMRTGGGHVTPEQEAITLDRIRHGKTGG